LLALLEAHHISHISGLRVNPHCIHGSEKSPTIVPYDVIFTLKDAIFFPRSSTAIVSLDLITVEASTSYADTSHSVRLLWMNDWSVAETYTWHTSITTDRHAPGGIRSHNPRLPAAANPCLRSINFTPQSFCPQGNNPGTHRRGSRWAPEPVWTVSEEEVYIYIYIYIYIYTSIPCPRQDANPGRSIL
jgi:hypothetical protein